MVETLCKPYAIVIFRKITVEKLCKTYVIVIFRKITIAIIIFGSDLCSSTRRVKFDPFEFLRLNKKIFQFQEFKKFAKNFLILYYHFMKSLYKVCIFTKKKNRNIFIKMC